MFKILNTMKQLFTFTPMLMQFKLAKVYHKVDKKCEGSFVLQANKELHIASITIQITETLKISKDESETIVLGSKVFREALHMIALDKHESEFIIPLKFSRQTKREHKTYKGDLGPLNKATDNSKRQLYVYKALATIKLKWQKETITHEEVLRFE